MDLSIIIINYNGGLVLSECVSSVLEFIDGFDYEIIVYDNGSTDDSLNMLPSGSGISVIKGKENLGFGRANNAAVKASSGKYVLLLNNDARFTDSSFATVFDFVKTNSGTIATCKIINSGNTPESSAGFLPTVKSEVMNWGINKIKYISTPFTRPHFIDTWKKDEIIYPERITGCFMLMEREVFNALNGFDGNFFMYYEDSDFCKRAAEHGFKPAYFPFTSIEHIKGHSRHELDEYKTLEYSFDSCRYYISKHFGGKALARFDFRTKFLWNASMIFLRTINLITFFSTEKIQEKIQLINKMKSFNFGKAGG